MRWIKASERLPNKCGETNKVIIRGKSYDLTGYEATFGGSSGPFVTYGFRNYDEENPKMYFLIGNHSFLHNNVEWLDEGQSDSDAVEFGEWIKMNVEDLDNTDVPKLYELFKAR